MDNKNKTLPKIENECQLADRMTKRYLKLLNDKIFDDFMEQTKCDDCCDMRKEDEGK